MRWSTWWNWGYRKNRKVKVIHIEDEGPPIESSNIWSDPDSHWTGEVLPEIDLPKNEGGYLGAGIGVELQPGEEIYNRHNSPPSRPDLEEENRKLKKVFDAAATTVFWMGTSERLKENLLAQRDAIVAYNHQEEDDRALEPPKETPAAPTGSVEAADMAYALGQGFPLNSYCGGLWGHTSARTSLDDLKSYAADRGKDWTSPAVQTQFMVEHFGREGGMMILPLAEDQAIGQDPANEPQLEPLHREFLLTITHVHDVIGDKGYAEKMREDLLDLWREDKVAKGLTAPQALGMTEDEYSAWVEKKGE